MKKYIIISLFLVLGVELYAQGGMAYDEIALKLSRNYFGGTARSMSMAGAFGALGADVSTLSSNPAGLGVYRTGEYSITPTVNSTGTESNFVNNSMSDNKTHFNINEFGFIGVIPSGNSHGLISVNLGFGMNRLADFHRNYSASANGTEFSQIDAFVNSANGISYDDINSRSWKSGPAKWIPMNAWNTGLIGSAIDPDGSLSGHSYIPVLGRTGVDGATSNEKVNQYNKIRESGRIDEYDFSIGFNINNKLYLGATVGLQDIYYANSIFHAEDFENSLYTTGDGYDVGYNYFEDKIINGSGVNFKLGAIFTPTPSLRLGLAFHTPTFINITEDYSTKTEIYQPDNMSPRQYYDGKNYYYAYDTHSADTPNGSGNDGHLIQDTSHPNVPARNDFGLRTPMKGILSAAYVFGKTGLISFDYEYSNYSNMNLSSTNNNMLFGPDNQAINNRYSNTNTFRVGGEYHIDSHFLFRAGYAYYGSPYNEGYAKDNGYGYETATNFVTTGLGYRYSNFFVDFAYVVGSSKINDYSMYNAEGATVDYKLTQQRFALTLGVRLERQRR